RARSRSIVSMSIATPDGKPSTTAVRPGPCDSPAVKKRSGISPASPLLPEPLGRRQRGGPVGDDLRGDEDEELLAMRRVEVPLEEPTEGRDAAQVRDAGLALVGGVAEDAAEHDGLGVRDEHVRVRLAADLVRDAVDRSTGCEVRLAR